MLERTLAVFVQLDGDIEKSSLTALMSEVIGFGNNAAALRRKSTGS
jgi:hypothetical protein